MGGRFGDGPWAGAPSAGFRMSPMDSVSSMYSAILRELLATDFLYNFTNTNKLHAFQTPSIEFLYHRYNIIVCKHEKL